MTFRKRTFGGETYLLYGTTDMPETARRVAQTVRDNGGKARIIKLNVWASASWLKWSEPTVE